MERKGHMAWRDWIEGSFAAMEAQDVIRSLHTVDLLPSRVDHIAPRPSSVFVDTYSCRGPWDYSATHVTITDATFRSWMGSHGSSKDIGTDSVPGSSRPLTLFSGNDYLGLSSHPTVRTAAANAALDYGMGPRASALVTGYTNLHRKLESELAALCHTEECLLCPSGFSANLAVMSALGVGQVTIFSDELNHASIIDGIRLVQRQQEGAVVKIYRHCDMQHLEELLSSCPTERKLVATDSIFSMDGDFAPLVSLAALRKKYGFLLVVDEAHATLVCGDEGSGAIEAFGLDPADVDFHVGTLSKAIGCQGGFIACSKMWKTWLASRGRSFIYSTALTVPIVVAASASLNVARVERWRQVALWENVEELSRLMQIRFYSPICPILIGGAREALEASKKLLALGFHVPAIRPPTVSMDTCRLRVALSASHTKDDILKLAKALLDIMPTRNSLLSMAHNTSITWFPPQHLVNDKTKCFPIECAEEKFKSKL